MLTPFTPPPAASPDLRPISPIAEGKKLRREPVPPPPKIAWLALDQLVVDEAYQRGLSAKSTALIRRLVERWNWNCFKPLSVAATGDGRYEVLDGQHTAIAAATHGSIETLPCLVLPAETRREKAAAFVGVNRDRVALTPFAIYRAELMAEEPEAVAVDQAVRASGATLIESLRYDMDYPAGTLACVSTLRFLVRQKGGPERLRRALAIARAAEISPVPSGLLRVLNELIDAPGLPGDAAITEALLDIGNDDLAERADERKRKGLAPNRSVGMQQVLLLAIEQAEAA